MERLNNYLFSDNEWDNFFRNRVANQNLGIEEKTFIIQEDFIQLPECDDDTVRNILTSFDEFKGREILTERDVQDYHSAYIDLYREFRELSKRDAENVNDDIVFEMELIKQVEINIDYILMLIKKYHEDHIKNREIKTDIYKAVDSSVELRNKKDLIESFIDSLTPATVVDDDWRKFVDSAFRDGYVQTTGTALTKVLPPMSRFSAKSERPKKRESVLEKINAFFNKFWDISGGKLFNN